MRLIDCILVDPFACTVTKVQYDADDYKQIYGLLSHETMKVSNMEACYPAFLKGADTMYVDEEGLFKDCQRWVIISGHPQPLAGKGLIVGTDAEGESVSCLTDIEVVKQKVLFAGYLDGRLVATVTPFE